jgi:putative hemolysin
VIHLQFLYTIGLILLLVLDLVTEAAQSGLSNNNLARRLAQREPMTPQVEQTLRLLQDHLRLQASLKLSQNLMRFLLAGLSIVLFAPPIQSISPAYAMLIVLALSSIVLFLFEWTVDMIATSDPETWALRLTPYARVLKVVCTPLVSPILSLQADSSHAHEGAVTEDELRTLVEVGQQEGLLEQGERQMIFSIFRLGNTLAREIMVPRIDILALDVNTPVNEAINALQKSGHSRVPVFKETVDDIQGLLYAKDMLRIWREGNQIPSLAGLLRPAYFIPEAKKVDELLAELQTRRIHMAIVVDEYGGVAGLVTLEDIVEEIVGEILDEYDQAEEMPYQVIGEDEYVFQGRVDLNDFNEIMGAQLPKDDADTLGGFIYSYLGRVPTGGEHVHLGDLELIVEQVSGKRIRKVRAEKVHAQSGPTVQENGDEVHAN